MIRSRATLVPSLLPGNALPWRLCLPNRCRSSRSAFTLIELMIALGLLGALMAVAWSLLGTFRDAEIRGWKVSYRTQTIRSARAWLENDVQHFIPAASPSSFIGNKMGFTAMIEPSIDPIPFLANLMSNSERSEVEPSVLDSTLGQESSVTPANHSPWPAEAVEIEYELMPVPTRTATSSVRTAGNTDKTLFVLTRREKGTANTAEAVLPRERNLSAKDLYRQTNNEVHTSGRTIRESRIEGLLKAQFRYYDGTAWRSEWNNAQQNGLPRGIALGFDFPANTDIQNPSNSSANLKDQRASSSENSFVSDLPLADSALATDATAESQGTTQGLMESSTNENQIVIYVGNGFPKLKPVANQRGLP